MSGNTSTGPMSLGNLLNSTTPPGPPGDSTTTSKPIIRLAYCQCHGNGDHLRALYDDTGRVIRSILRGDLQYCEIRTFERNNNHLLDLGTFTDKFREQKENSFGISIPGSSLSDDFEYRQPNNSKIKLENGRFFIKMT
ncbi:MAG: hypothetical protein EOP34_04045 [Rickettsiales bacterium]|nr:MAG: hypothetical protein EOP34_04045 [Rickettsiales bacterium]